MKMVKVFWTDARVVQYEVTAKELEHYNLPKGFILGFLVSENEESVKVAPVMLNPSSGLDPEEATFKSVWIVPRSQVKKIVELEEKKE